MDSFIVEDKLGQTHPDPVFHPSFVDGFRMRDPTPQLCITRKFSKRSHSNPNGIPPQSPARVGRHDLPWEQSSKRHFQRRRCCAKHRRLGRNPVGVKGNEAAPQIVNLWVMHSSEEGN